MRCRPLRGIFFVYFGVISTAGVASYKHLSPLCLAESLQLTTAHQLEQTRPFKFSVFVSDQLPTIGFQFSKKRSLQCQPVVSIFLRVNCKARPSHSQKDFYPFCEFTDKEGQCHVSTYNTWFFEPQCWCQTEEKDELAFGVTAILGGQCELDVTLKGSGFGDLDVPHWLTFVIKPRSALDAFTTEPPSTTSSLSAAELPTDVQDLYTNSQTSQNVTKIGESVTGIDHNVTKTDEFEATVCKNSSEEGVFDKTEHHVYVGVGVGALFGISVAISVAIRRRIRRSGPNGQANQRSPSRNDNAGSGVIRNNLNDNNDHRALVSVNGTYQEISDIDETIAVAVAPPLPPLRPCGTRRPSGSPSTVQPPLPRGPRAVPQTTQAFQSALNSASNDRTHRSHNQDARNAVITTPPPLPWRNRATQQFAPLLSQTRGKRHSCSPARVTTVRDTLHDRAARADCDTERSGFVAASPQFPWRNKAIPMPRRAEQSLATNYFYDDGHNTDLYSHEAKITLPTLTCDRKLLTPPPVPCGKRAAPQHAMQGFGSTAESSDFDHEDHEISLRTLTSGQKPPPELKPSPVPCRGRGSLQHAKQAFHSTCVQRSGGRSDHTDVDHYDAERNVQSQTSCRNSRHTLKPTTLPRRNIGIPRGTKEQIHIPRSTQFSESRVDRSKPSSRTSAAHSSKSSNRTRCLRWAVDAQDITTNPLRKQKRNVSQYGMATESCGGTRREMKDGTWDSDKSNTEVKQIFSSRKHRHTHQRYTRTLQALRKKPAALTPKGMDYELNNEMTSLNAEMACLNIKMDSFNVGMDNSDVKNISSNNADKRLYENTRESNFSSITVDERKRSPRVNTINKRHRKVKNVSSNKADEKLNENTGESKFSSITGDERKRSPRVTTVHKRRRKVSRSTDHRLQDVAKWLLNVQQSCGDMDTLHTDNEDSGPDHGQTIHDQSDEGACSQIQDPKLQDVASWVLSLQESGTMDVWHTDNEGSDTETT